MEYYDLRRRNVEKNRMGIHSELETYVTEISFTYLIYWHMNVQKKSQQR